MQWHVRASRSKAPSRTSRHPFKTRLAKHNRGEVLHTAKYLPWAIDSAHAFKDREKAAEFELYLKSHSGREFAKRHC
jgi:predicted GIY-YIG superfamily endonuclease